MGKFFIFSIVIFFLGISNFLQAQSGTEKNISIEVKAGYANTLHWNSPIAIYTYIDGGRVLEQTSNYELQYELCVQRQIRKNQAFNIGVGVTNFSFSQVREDWTGIIENPYTIVKEEFRFQFLSIIAGHRFYFKNRGRLSIYWGNDLIIDMVPKPEYQIKGGISFKSQIGINCSLTDNILITADAFGRTALMYYNKNKNYLPRMMGLEVGLNYEF